MSELSIYVDALRKGQVVACATETQMGLLADGLDGDAVARVVALKGRDAGDPIALLLPTAEALSRVALDVSEALLRLCTQHWPGPLTVLVPARPELPPQLSKDGLVGVRVPGPSPALQLVRIFGGPLTGTSANLSGQPAAITTAHVRETFGESLPVLPMDAPGGQPSTVVTIRDGQLHIIRPGAISAEQLEHRSG